MKIAIASSGLGHVARGVETWAKDTAVSLGGSRFKVQGSELEVTLFSGAPCVEPLPCTRKNLSCIKRRDVLARVLTQVAPGFTWRWGWKSAVGWEQYTFWRALRKELRRGSFDILHTQDALLGKLCNDDVKKGYWNGKVILAHGTEEPPEFLAQLPYVQHLTPWQKQHAMRAASERCEVEGNKKETHSFHFTHGTLHGEEASLRNTMDFAIPNFVDTGIFRPAGEKDHRPKTIDHRQGEDGGAKPETGDLRSPEGNRPALCWQRSGKPEGVRGETNTQTPKYPSTQRPKGERGLATTKSAKDTKGEAGLTSSFRFQASGFKASLGIPADAFVIGCVAAVKKGHKRIDYLIREYAATIRGDHRHETHPSRLAAAMEGTALDHRPEVSGRWMSGVEPAALCRDKVGGRQGRDRTELKASTGNAATQQPDNLTTRQLNNPTTQQPFLLIAGAKTDESEELVNLAEELAPGQVKFLFDLSREEMPNLYRAMDLFVLTSLFEMMPIAILEALSTGLPCVVNKHPNLEWMIGDGGMSVDMSREGALARALWESGEGEKCKAEGIRNNDPVNSKPQTFNLSPCTLHQVGAKARARAEKVFAKEVVVPQMLEMYEAVLTGSGENLRDET